MNTTNQSVSTIETLSREKMKLTRKHKIFTRRSIKIIDAFASLFLIGPLVVIYWRGTWGLLDTYVFPQSPCQRGWVCLTAGMAVLMVLETLQDFFTRSFQDLHVVCFVLASRLHSYAMSLASVAQWCGTWLLLSFYLELARLSKHHCLAVFVGSTLLLMLCRASKNLTSPPLAITVDTDRQSFFTCHTRFEIQSSHPILRTLDVGFSIAIVGNLVAAAWWGAWQLIATTVFPENPMKSALASTGCGYAITIVSLINEFPASKISKMLDVRSFLWKLLFEDCFLLIGSCGTILIWKGIWSLCDELIYPGQLKTSFWLTHGVGYSTLLVTLCTNTIAARSCLVDGSSARGAGVFSDLGYFSILILKAESHSFESSVTDTTNTRY